MTMPAMTVATTNSKTAKRPRSIPAEIGQVSVTEADQRDRRAGLASQAMAASSLG